jgi:conjugal transfer pilus assembly protein TraK
MNTPNRTRLSAWTLPFSFAIGMTALPAAALQLVDARDGVTVEAVVSNKEPTRIRIENAPITDVFGNLYSSNCAPPASAIAGTAAPSTPPVNPSGEIALECDRDKGEIYVRPMGNSSKPINLFVSSASATYTLLLRRSDTPSDTVVIRDKSVRPAGKEALSGNQGPLGPSANHVRAMKSLVVAMTTGHFPGDARVDDVSRDIQLWSEARFTLTRVAEMRGLVGETYRLTNVSNQPMVLAEQEFDRESGNVVGVAIDNLNLLPGDSTNVYIVRTGSGT